MPPIFRASIDKTAGKVKATIDQLKVVYGPTLTAADAHKLKEQP